jgi:hypothetical protein
MTENHDRQQSRQQAVTVLERGNIYFFYRPKIEEGSAEGLADVQRLYMILSPHGQRRYRLIVIGQKQLPEISDSGEKSWGFVENVSREPQELKDVLGSATYHTKTRGQRTQPAARPAGEGVYAIVRHADHTHLAYALELPARPGAVQQELNIEEEGSYILSVKNPELPATRGIGLDEARQASFPSALQKRFRGRRFIGVDSPAFLDHAGAELLFIGASEEVSGELGVQLHPQEETEATAEIFQDLRLEKSRYPLKPLFEGSWQ